MLNLTLALQLSCHCCQLISNLLAFAFRRNNPLESHSEQEPFFPWETRQQQQNSRASVMHHRARRRKGGGGFALYHWLPVPSIYLFLMKGSSSCRRAWDSAWWGRGLGPCSHCPHMLSACVAGVAEISLVLEHHSVHS